MSMVYNLMSVWSTVGGVVLAVLILLVMITIHEFGHYIAGKLLKFRINEFSIGFGPALFKRKSKKTGELFALRLIPLGGYCAFDGEDGLDEETKDEAPISAEEPFKDLQTADPKAEWSAEHPASELSGAERTETPVPRGGKFTEMAPWKRIIVLIAGAAMNYFLALILIVVMFACFGQSMVMVRGSDVTDDFPAEYSFQAGDILLGAEGTGFYLNADIALSVNGGKKGDIVTFTVLRETPEGRQRMEQEIMLREDVVIKNSTQVSAAWKALGIGIEEREDPASETGYSRYYMLSSAEIRFGFFETVGRSFVYSFKIAGFIFRVLGELLTGHLGLDAFGGPVTTITMTSQIAATGVRNFLEITAYIGVNLAVFNLLPIPALDGSKVVFTAIEWVRGKPISRKVEAAIHAVGFVLIFGFAILVDILQFI